MLSRTLRSNLRRLPKAAACGVKATPSTIARTLVTKTAAPRIATLPRLTFHRFASTSVKVPRWPSPFPRELCSPFNKEVGVLCQPWTSLWPPSRPTRSTS
ncbi:hypothetical protein OXX69_013876, partial [Metschnikowia pulcherrima]